MSRKSAFETLALLPGIEHRSLSPVGNTQLASPCKEKKYCKYFAPLTVKMKKTVPRKSAYEILAFLPRFEH